MIEIEEKWNCEHSQPNTYRGSYNVTSDVGLDREIMVIDNTYHLSDQSLRQILKEDNSDNGQKCHMIIPLRNKKNKQLIRFGRMFCGSWHCDICRPKLIRKWWGHICYLWEIEDNIFKTEIKPEEWDTIYKWIQRHNGTYLRIKQLNGNYVIFSTVSPGTWELLMDEKGQQDVLFETFLNIDNEHKPISTSRKWKLKEKKTENSKEWEKIDIDLRNITLEEIQIICIEEKLNTCPISRFELYKRWTDGIDVIIPENKFEEIMEKLENYGDPYGGGLNS